MISCFVCKGTIHKKSLVKKSRQIRKNAIGTFHYNCYQQYQYQHRIDNRKVHICLPKYSAAEKGKCLFSHCTNENNEKIPPELRRNCFVQKGTFIAKGSFVCKQHHTSLVSQSFLANDLNKISDSFWISFAENTKLMAQLIDSVTTTKKKSKFISFGNMDESQLTTITGLQSHHLGYLQSLLHEKRIGVEIIVMYFFKLRSGLSSDDRMVGALAGKSQQAINYHINKVRELLMKLFVPKYLGLHLIDSHHMELHTTKVAKALIGDDRSIVVLDGTYIYCQKSENFDFQRSTFSLHKHRNLYKMFMCVTTDGWIIDATGPFDANTSDAKLSEDLMCIEQFTQKFPPNATTLVVDRGFRDIIERAQLLGYDTMMPAFLEKNEKQLSTEKASESRCTTKLRYIVEVVNGQIKRTFPIFNQIAFNRALPNSPDHFRIACAVINLIKNGNFHSDKQNGDEIALRIRSLMMKPNLLGNIVKEMNLTRRTSLFVENDILHTDVQQNYNFPILEQRDLEMFCCGTYQPKMVLSYYAEHIKHDGRYQFFVEKENKKIDFDSYGIEGDREILKLFKARMDSRHSKNSKYYIFLLLNTDAEGIDRIQEHYCTCKVGMRTVGCCAHIA